MRETEKVRRDRRMRETKKVRRERETNVEN